MKKILFVANTLQIGGAEKILFNILKNIDKNKYDITVLALVNYGVLVNEIKKIEGVKYIGGYDGILKKTELQPSSVTYKAEKWIMQRKLRKYTNILKKSETKTYKTFVKDEYDVEIAFLEGRVSKFVSKSTNPKSKKIAWIHTDINNDRDIKENFFDIEDEINCFKKFDKIVCVSEMVKEKFMEKTGIVENVQVQLNPIDSNNILELSKESIQFNRKNGEPILCAVGRLEPVKGYDRLLEIHKKLLEQSIRHQLWFVGDGSEMENMKNYIRKNNLEDSVTMWGYQKNPYKFIKNADIYVCSSYFEGLSSTVIEATFLEKIIVTTDCPGMEEILGKNNENAMIVKNDTEALLEGLKEILTNEGLRKKYKNNISRRRDLFNLENTMKKIEEIIEE